MSYSKIDLENRIFARADRLGEAVWGWEGELVYAGKDLYLQLLMCVYNGFFAAENRAFLADTDECCGPILKPSSFIRLRRFCGVFPSLFLRRILKPNCFYRAKPVFLRLRLSRFAAGAAS